MAEVMLSDCEYQIIQLPIRNIQERSVGHYLRKYKYAIRINIFRVSRLAVLNEALFLLFARPLELLDMG